MVGAAGLWLMQRGNAFSVLFLTQTNGIAGVHVKEFATFVMFWFSSQSTIKSSGMPSGSSGLTALSHRNPFIPLDTLKPDCLYFVLFRSARGVQCKCPVRTRIFVFV